MAIKIPNWIAQSWKYFVTGAGVAAASVLAFGAMKDVPLEDYRQVIVGQDTTITIDAGDTAKHATTEDDWRQKNRPDMMYDDGYRLHVFTHDVINTLTGELAPQSRVTVAPPVGTQVNWQIRAGKSELATGNVDRALFETNGYNITCATFRYGSAAAGGDVTFDFDGGSTITVSGATNATADNSGTMVVNDSATWTHGGNMTALSVATYNASGSAHTFTGNATLTSNEKTWSDSLHINSSGTVDFADRFKTGSLVIAAGAVATAASPDTAGYFGFDGGEFDITGDTVVMTGDVLTKTAANWLHDTTTSLIRMTKDGARVALDKGDDFPPLAFSGSGLYRQWRRYPCRSIPSCRGYRHMGQAGYIHHTKPDRLGLVRHEYRSACNIPVGFSLCAVLSRIARHDKLEFP